MNTALYLRVSTEGQTDKHGLDTQRAACQEYARRHGLTITQEYVDAYTGTTEIRASLTDLLSEAANYQHVLTYSVDRIARTVPAAYSIVQQLQNLGLTVHTTLDGVVNLEDDSDALKFGVNAIFADMERRKIATRTHAGRIARGLKGQLPNGSTAFGYTLDKTTGTLTILEKEAEIIREMFELSKTLPNAKIAEKFNEEGKLMRNGTLWRASRIGKMVKNPLYKGQYIYGKSQAKKTKTPITISVPPIVDEVTWKLAQKTGNTTKRNTNGFLLKGRCTCGVCGHAFSPKHSIFRRPNGKIHDTQFYYCTKDPVPGGRCTNKTARRLEFETAVMTSLREILSNPEKVKEVFKPQVKTVNLAPLEERDQKALQAFKLGALTPEEFAQIRQEIQREKQQLLAGVQEATVDVPQVLQDIQGMTDAEILQYLNVHVVVHPHGLEIKRAD